MDTENRRSFVKKSLATSVTISFSGLIRARGEEGGETTTSDPWGDTTAATTEGTTETWATTASTEETTSPWGEETTEGTPSEETTTETTGPSGGDHPLTRAYLMNIYVKSLTPKTGGGYTATFTKNRNDAMVFNGTQPAVQVPSITGSPDADGGHGSLEFGNIEMPDGTGDNQQDQKSPVKDDRITPNPNIIVTADDVGLNPGETRILYTGIIYYHWK